MATRKLTEAELADVIEQRDFLLRSLDDLEAEYEAGDIDAADYEELKDDYTVRAAAVIRSLDARRAREKDEDGRRPWWRVLVALGGVLVLSVVAGVLVAQASGERQTGDTATGEIRETVRGRLDRAADATAAGDFDEALARYEDVLADDPDNVEAMTYQGWTLALAGELRSGVEMMDEAIRLAPEYPDPHALLAVTYFRSGRTDPAVEEFFFDQARERLESLDELDLSDRPDIEQLLGPVRGQLEES